MQRILTRGVSSSTTLPSSSRSSLLKIEHSVFWPISEISSSMEVVSPDSKATRVYTMRFPFHPFQILISLVLEKCLILLYLVRKDGETSLLKKDLKLSLKPLETIKDAL